MKRQDRHGTNRPVHTKKRADTKREGDPRMSRRVCILGAGGLARETFDIYIDLGRENEVLGFLEEHCKREGTILNERPVNDISYLTRFSGRNKPYLIAAIGSTKRKRLIVELEEESWKFDTVVHPSAIHSKWVRIGEGSIVAAGTIMTCQVNIGRHVILNLGVRVGHDVNIGDFCTISPGACIMGRVNVGVGAFVGSNATLVNDVTVGDYALVAAGAVVVDDVPELSLVAGVPAKVKKAYESLDQRPW